jgi:NAD(P)-dependent dehydrogenase (short-subunit alcohol dehydrogenase family)
MKQKTIVITGSTGGIGFGLAKEFLTLGHKIVINGRTAEKLSKAISELQNINPDVIGVTGSVSRNETHESIVDKAISEFGKIDIWINNAGIPQAHKMFVDIDDTELSKIIDTNIYGLMLGTRTAAKHMTRQGFGKIFNMEGFGSNGRIMRKLSVYGTTKRAVNYYTKSVANEIKDYPVQIGILSPGMVRTDFLNNSKEFMSGDEAKKFEKVYNALAEDVEPVTKYLVQQILKSSKNYDRIEYLTKTKLIFKLIKMMMS